MSKLFTLFVLIFSSILISLKVNANAISEKEKLRTLLDSANVSYEQQKIDQGLKFARQAYDQAIHLQDSSSMLKALNLKANLYFDRMELATAEKEFKLAEVFAWKQNDTLLLINSISGQAKILGIQGENLKSLMLSQKAIELAGDFDHDLYYGILSNMNVPYVKLGQYENALDCLLEAKDYYEKIQKENALAIIYNNIGEIYRGSLLNFPLAEKHYKKAVALNLRLNDERQLAKNYNNLGINFKHQEQPDSALYYLFKSKEIKEKNGDIGGVAISVYNIGDLYLEMEKFTEAIDNFNQTLKISEELGIREGFYYAYQGLGKAYLKSGQKDKAWSYFQKVKEITDQLNNPELNIAAGEMFYNYYKETGNFSKALSELEELQVKKDSINKLLRDKGFTELRIVYEKELSEAETRILQAQQADDKAIIAFQKKVEYLLFTLAGLLVITLLILLFFYKQRKIMLLQEKMANVKLHEQYVFLEQQEKKLEEVNQMKDKIFSVLGHDLRSPLNSILVFIQMLERNDLSPDQKIKYLDQLKNETGHTLKTLENILAWSRLQSNDKIVSRKEINIELLFSDISNLYQPLAAHKSIKLWFRHNSSRKLIGDQNQIQSVVANLVSNAIKFSPPNETIIVEFSEFEDDVIISVSDSGSGIKPEVLQHLNDRKGRFSTPGTNGEKGTGIGLKLVKDFVNLNGGKLTFENKKPKGTRAMVKFPITSTRDTTYTESDFSKF
ncbi:hypothetical protein BH23BAC1_BH23BAC1_08530 [soil metagenome]